MCLACGFDGGALQSDHREGVWVCPRCGSDLYARPPRSYAELEGLADSTPRPWAQPAPTGVRHADREQRPLSSAGHMPLSTIIAWSMMCFGLAAVILVAGILLGSVL